MADDANDVQSNDITPEDFLADEQDSPKAAPSAAKTDAKADVETKPEAKVEEEVKPSAKPPEEEGKDKAEDTEGKPKGAEDRKAQLEKDIEDSKEKLGIDPSTEIRDLVAAKNALRESVSKANSDAYKPATEEELTAEGMSATDAKLEAMKQSMEMRDYTEKVAEAQLTIESESNRILRDFGWANPQSENFKEELANEASQLLQANLIIDPNTNQVIGSNISPYQLYKTLDRASGIERANGQIEGQQATEKQMANADPASSAAPPKKSENPLDKLWEGDL